MSRRTWFFIAAVFAVGLVVFAVGKALEQSVTSTASYPAPVDRIELKVGSGNVKFTATPGTSVEVKRTDHYTFGKPSIDAVAQGPLLDLKQECGFHIGTCATDFEVLVPSNVTVRVDGGDVEATGLRAELSAENVDSLKGSELFGKVTATSGSGRVDLQKISSVDVSAKTKSGDVKLESAVQPNFVTLDTESGNVVLRLPEKNGPYKIDATTQTGKLTLELPNSPDAKSIISAKSKAGDVDVRGN